MRTASPLILVLACVLPLAGCVSTGERKLEIPPTTTLAARTGSVLKLDFPSGEVRITPSTDGLVHADVTFYCDANSKTCLKNAKRAKIIHEQRGELSELRFKPGGAYSARHANLLFTLQVPTLAQVDISMDAGDIDIVSPSACLNVSLAAGDLSISVPESSIRSAHLDANLGDAKLRTTTGYAEDRRTLLVGSELKWNEGTGSCDLKAKLQAGSINVQLTENAPQA